MGKGSQRDLTWAVVGMAVVTVAAVEGTLVNKWYASIMAHLQTHLPDHVGTLDYESGIVQGIRTGKPEQLSKI